MAVTLFRRVFETSQSDPLTLINPSPDLIERLCLERQGLHFVSIEQFVVVLLGLEISSCSSQNRKSSF